MSNMGITSSRLSMQDFTVVGGNVQTASKNEVGNGANAPSFGQKIKDAFENFGNKISEKFAAFKEKLGGLGDSVKTYFEGVKERRAEKAETQRLLKSERLDTKDREAVGKNPTIDLDSPSHTNVTTFTDKPDFKKVSNELTGILSQIKTRAEANNIDPLALRREVIATFISLGEAGQIREADTQAISGLATKFQKEGRTEKADFMRDLLQQIEDSRTPDGATERFKETALGVAEQGALTFLRSTTSEDAACLKKLMDGHGAGAISNELRQTANGKIAQEPSFGELAEELKKAGVGNMSNKDMTKAQASEIGVLALRLLDLALTKPVTDGMKETLGDVSNAISQHGGTEVNDKTHKLYSDQLVLKMISPALSKDTPLMRMAADFINVVANGVKDQTKWSDAGREVFAQLGPKIHERLENHFIACGMPETARTTW